MADSRLTLIKILARVRPEVWELVGGGPLGDHYNGPGPQPWKFGPVPDPWRFGPLPDPWRISGKDVWALSAQLAVVDLTRRLTDAASLTQAQGGDGPRFLRSVMDDDGWGIEGRPIEPKLPTMWWRIKLPPRPPRPNEDDVLAVFGAAAVSFAALSEQIEDEALSMAVGEAGLRMLDIAVEASAQLQERGAG